MYASLRARQAGLGSVHALVQSWTICALHVRSECGFPPGAARRPGPPRHRAAAPRWPRSFQCRRAPSPAKTPITDARCREIGGALAHLPAVQAVRVLQSHVVAMTQYHHALLDERPRHPTRPAAGRLRPSNLFLRKSGRPRLRANWHRMRTAGSRYLVRANYSAVRRISEAVPKRRWRRWRRWAFNRKRQTIRPLRYCPTIRPLRYRPCPDMPPCHD